MIARSISNMPAQGETYNYYLNLEPIEEDHPIALRHMEECEIIKVLVRGQFKLIEGLQDDKGNQKGTFRG